MPVLTQLHRAIRPVLPLILTAVLPKPLASASDATAPTDSLKPPTTQVRTSDGVPTRLARNAPVLIAYLENDYFGGTDQHYTNGFKVAWLSPDLTDWGKSGWRQRFLEAVPFVNEDGAQKNLGLGLGQQIFTPRDTERANPDPTDRPYAGWAYFEFSFLAKTDQRADTVALQLGIVGPHSYAEDVQLGYHRIIGVDRPKGWDYQLHDEPGVNVAWERKWRLYSRTVLATDRLGIHSNPFSPDPLPQRAHWGYDFMPHFGAVVGNVSTYANAGATVRFGYNLPSDFGVNLMRPAGLTDHPLEDITLENITVETTGGITLADVAAQSDAHVNAFFLRTDEPGVSGPRGTGIADVPERPHAYPEPSMFGLLPASALFARHVRGLTLNNVTLTTVSPDERPPVLLDEVTDLTIEGGNLPL